MAEEQLDKSLADLNKNLKEQNKVLRDVESLREVSSSIEDLKGGLLTQGSKNAKQLEQQLAQVKLAFDSATNEEELELAREQLELLRDNSSTEEENRERAKREEQANFFLEKQLEGINKFADGFDKLMDNMKPSAGLLAGLGAAALLFMDPETLFAGVRAAIDGVFAIVDSITAFLNGDLTGAMQALEGNMLAVSGIVGTIALLFGGRIIRAFGGLVKGIQGIVRAVQVFRVFMLGSFVPGMVGFFSTISAAVAPILVAAAPFIAIGALVAAGVYAIYEAFKTAKDVFDETGSITETMVTFATDIVTAPLRWIKNLSAWVLSKLGFEELATKLNNFDITKTITDTVMGTIDWIKGIFTNPVAALQQAWNGLVGEGGLIDIIYSPIDKAIAWIQGLFGWGNPEEPFKLSTLVKDAFTSAKDWIVGLFTWGAEAGTGEDGVWSLSTFVSGAFTEVKNWFTKLFAWGAEAGQENIILDLFDSAIEKIKTFFTDLFDFLPSFAEIKASLTSMLPEWMKPDSIEDQRAELIDQLAAMEAAAANALPAAEQFDNPLTNDTREDFEAEAAAIRAQLAELPQANKGGFMNAPASGGLAMLHGAEIVAPLDSPQGKVLMAINDLMNAKSAAGAGEYGGMGGPMIVQGGSNSSSNNTNNVSTSTYTIQQGITPDDFLKRDFVNFSY